MSQDTLPRGNRSNNAPDHDPAATPAPAEAPSPLPLERIDAHELAQHVAEGFNEERDRVVVFGPHAVVPTQPGILRPILRLLVQDALRAADEASTVTIQIRSVGYDVDVLVKDPSVIPAEVSGAGAGLAEAAPLARRIGARIQLSLDDEGRSEVRVRLPRLDPNTTALVVGDTHERVAAHAARLGLSTLGVASVEEALGVMFDGGRVSAVVILPTAWDDARSRDILTLKNAVSPSPMISIGTPPEPVAFLIHTALEEPVSHGALREALLSARQT